MAFITILCIILTVWVMERDVFASYPTEESPEYLLLRHPGYVRLRDTLAFYRSIQERGGWPGVPVGPMMSRGATGERITALKHRLIVSGDLPISQRGDGAIFDEALEEAVRRFQRRHGLDVDGVVGPATLEALNVSVNERIRQIKKNMERWRWVPHDLGIRIIAVNIAGFWLQALEKNRPILEMRVVAGKRYTRTPVFRARMTHAVFRPYWNVPSSIARKEMLPLIKRDPGYLEKNRLRVFRGWDPENGEIDPKNIDWSQLAPHHFPYRLRQDPGPMNALGRVKFVFPNRFNVYLHDTPERELFARTVRGFSHGCIRVEKPVELAQFVLRDDPRWTRERILLAMEEGSANQIVRLHEPITVHIEYWTAWVDEDGTAQFRKDIYEWDELLEEELEEEP
jgi:murein L,D-transpeptidase YcbB/YkuD